VTTWPHDSGAAGDGKERLADRGRSPPSPGAPAQCRRRRLGPAYAYDLPLVDIAKPTTSFLSGILGSIGPVIVLGKMIGIIREKSGAEITMADSVIRVLCEHFPDPTMSIVGQIVLIPVACDAEPIRRASFRTSKGPPSGGPLSVCVGLR
jgi:H+/gluconate symporter-like permease